MLTSIGEELSVVCTVAAAYESLLVSLRGANAGIHFLASPLDVRSSTLVLIPKLATLIKKRISRSPRSFTNVTRPISILRGRPSRSARAAAAMFVGTRSVRRKSLPVPPGRIPSSTSLFDSIMPFATSEMVPSPPHAMISCVPCFAAAAATSRACPTASVNETVKAPKCVRRSLAIFGQFSRVAPSAEAGLTMTSGNDISAVLPQRTQRKKKESATKLHKRHKREKGHHGSLLINLLFFLCLFVAG